MATRINFNGSKFCGQAPDDLGALMVMLAEHPLERTFEAYGDFASEVHADLVSEEVAEPERARGGFVRFWGNFHDYSHAFSVDTNDPEVIARLVAAIKENKQRDDYKAQPCPRRVK